MNTWSIFSQQMKHIISKEHSIKRFCFFKSFLWFQRPILVLWSCCIYIWRKKSSSTLHFPENSFFWGFANAYVSKCRNITRCHRNMVDSALKSWWFILSDLNKIFFIRTYPEELHVLKYISSLHICTEFSQQWGQQMLAKCYPTSQGCSYDFQRLKVWPLGVPKPYRTTSYDLP